MADAAADGASDDADPPDSERRPSRLQTIVAAVIVVAVFVGATVLVAGDDAFELFDSSPESCAVESAPATLEADPPPSVRQTLSAEPVLQWTQVDAPVEQFYRTRTRDDGAVQRTGLVSDFHTTADGRIVVVVNKDGAHRLEITSNGTDWDAFPLPQDIDPTEIHISRDRWVIVGPALDATGEAIDPWAPDQVLLSRDQGVTWTEVPIDPGTPPFFNEQHLSTLDLMVSQGRIALATAVFPSPQLADLLVDRGLVADADEIHLGSVGVDSVMMLVPSDDPEFEHSTILFTYDEMDLSERQQTLTEFWKTVLGSGQVGYVRVYAGDENGLAITGEFDTDIARGAATRDGFMLTVADDDSDGYRYHASSDGRAWNEIPTGAPVRAQFADVGADGSIWTVATGDGTSSTIASLQCGQAPESLAVLGGLIVGGPRGAGLRVGDGGFVAIARPVPEFRSLFGFEMLDALLFLPSGRIAKNGFEFRLNEPEGGLTLWDVAQESPVYEWGDTLRMGPSPWVRESGTDHEYEVTFEDPDSSAELVIFAMDDLEEHLIPLRRKAARSLRGPVWIGWSRNGINWDWQTEVDAFGLSTRLRDAEVAVGRDFVIASVEPMEGDPIWFVTTTP
ncbi:hypothetical protein [Candidatus Poriferisodalis sp.]|uniref:hypothetical protein n=1 Tax=Candidatus Poriferisodalis sp. TaxID=3101277 RepID=UPI003B518086